MEENKSSVGSTVGTIIIIVIIIFGGLYFWGKRIEESRTKTDLMTNFTPGAVENFSADASTSDDLDSIEADLESTDLDNIAPEL